MLAVRVPPPLNIKSLLFEGVISGLMTSFVLFLLYIWWRYKKFGEGPHT